MNKTWTDEFGYTFTWEEIIEELQITRLVNRGFHDLLFKNNISVRDIANIEYQVRKNFLSDPEKAEPTKVKEVTVQKKSAKKSAKKRVKKK